MPVCPECNAEYREEFTLCADCACALIEKEPEKEKKPERAVFESINPVLLRSYRDATEADLAIGLLKDKKIPVLKKMREAGQVAYIQTGFTVFGVDIFVAPRNYEKASEILKAIEGDEESCDIQDETKAALTEESRKKRRKLWILLGVLWFIPLAIWIYIALKEYIMI